MLFVMVIATTGARGASSTELWRKEESLDSGNVGWQVNQLISLEQELDSYEQNRDINTSFAHNGDYFKARLMQLVKVESKDISISIIDPSQGELVSDNLEICVQINSLYEVQQVKAVVETLETTLIYSLIYSYGCWRGSISILGLTRGTKVLKITAIDIYGSTEVAETTFIYDQPPVLNIQAPLDLTIARPQLQLTISCTDDDPVGCASINVYSSVYYGTLTLIATGQNNINQSISLANNDGQYIKLSIYARDSAGQSVYNIRRVYVESSVKLHEVESVGGLLWDVQPDRILYVDCVSGALKILNRLTRQDTILSNLSYPPSCPSEGPIDSQVFRSLGFLTPLGAIFNNHGIIYDYQDGVLLGLGKVQSYLKVKGNYAIWNDDYLGQSNHLFLKNYITGTTISITTQNMNSDVASNGDVVYSLYNQIYRYRDGITTEIPSDVNPYRMNPLTDGKNIVYSTCDTFNQYRICDIVLYGESGKIILASGIRGEGNESVDYQINDGWIAYTKLGSGGQLQVWTHSPSGVDTQISFFGSSSQIGSLATNGEVTFVNRDRLYLSKPGLAPVDISSSLGKSFWQNGQWYIHIGRSLFLYDAYTISGNAGVAGVTLSNVVETMRTAVADANGNYLLTVPTNWSGTITPSKQGYIFSPANRTYSNVLADQTGQNYIATVTAIAYNISGNAEVSGATLSYTDGTPKTVISDSSGNYSLTVTYNWSGTVTPSKAGYTFTPASLTYTNVLADQTGQNYIALPVGPTISGNTWESGVTLSYIDGTPKTAISDGSGNYSLTVTYNWSGTVTPSKTGYAFSPENRTYTNVVENQTAQNYTAVVVTFTDVSNSYWAWSWIERLYAAGVTSGCSTNPMMYCPEDSVTRAQMAIFLERGKNGSAYTPPAATGMVFTDVSAAYWAAAWIEKLYADGITVGCATNPLRYCPEDPVTRAQMAIFLLRARHGSTYTPPAVGSSTGFNDISTSHWAAAWIKQLAAEGITTGCGGGNYCPEDSVTRAQMAVFLVRTFNLP